MPDPIVKSFWDKPTGSWQYAFHDPGTMKGAIVNPVLGYDPLAGASIRPADEVLQYVKEADIQIIWILYTHPHAAHFSAAPYLKERLARANCDWREKGREAMCEAPVADHIASNKHFAGLRPEMNSKVRDAIVPLPKL